MFVSFELRDKALMFQHTIKKNMYTCKPKKEKINNLEKTKNITKKIQRHHQHEKKK